MSLLIALLGTFISSVYILVTGSVNHIFLLILATNICIAIRETYNSTLEYYNTKKRFRHSRDTLAKALFVQLSLSMITFILITCLLTSLTILIRIGFTNEFTEFLIFTFLISLILGFPLGAAFGAKLAKIDIQRE